MNELVNRIKGIQNKQKSLMWGSAEHSENEVLIAVGSKVYPRQPQYFLINSSNEIFLISDSHKKELFRKCADSQEVISTVIELLKEWFPAKCSP